MEAKKPICFDTSFQSFKNAPDLKSHGLHSATLINGWGLNKTFSDGSSDLSQIDFDTCRYAANHPTFWKGREADMIVLDEESLPVHTEDRCHRDHIHDQLIEAVKIYREAHPGCAIGYYAMMPEDNFYGPLGNSGLPKWVHYKEYYDAWLVRNKHFRTNVDDKTLRTNNRGLAAYVDRVMPAVYPYLPLPEYMTEWKIILDGNVKEATKYGKPVIPYLCPQFVDREAGFPYVPAGVWKEMLEHALANDNVDGVCVYQVVNPELNFDYEANWWLETLEVRNDNH